MRNVVVVLFAATCIGAAPPTTPPDAVVEAQCRQYFKDTICSEALGRWLPHLPAGEDASPQEADCGLRRISRDRAADEVVRCVRTDCNVLRARIRRAAERHGRLRSAPPDCFLRAGLLYVLRDGLGLRRAAAARRGPNRALTQVRTDSGSGWATRPLGSCESTVTRRSRRCRSRPELRVLAYENAHPHERGVCVQDQTFAFKGGRSFSSACTTAADALQRPDARLQRRVRREQQFRPARRFELREVLLAQAAERAHARVAVARRGEREVSARRSIARDAAFIAGISASCTSVA